MSELDESGNLDAMVARPARAQSMEMFTTQYSNASGVTDDDDEIEDLESERGSTRTPPRSETDSPRESSSHRKSPPRPSRGSSGGSRPKPTRTSSRSKFQTGQVVEVRESNGRRGTVVERDSAGAFIVEFEEESGPQRESFLANQLLKSDGTVLRSASSMEDDNFDYEERESVVAAGKFVDRPINMDRVDSVSRDFGGSMREPESNTNNVVAKLYVSDDGKFKGTYDEVVKYEKQEIARKTRGSSADGRVLLRLYSSDDGKFKGLYDEVVEYEKQASMEAQNAATGRTAEGKVVFRLYESADGFFRGSLDEVNDYEEKVRNGTIQPVSGGMAMPLQPSTLKKKEGKIVFKLYESDDGKFQGTYDEVVHYEETAHERADNDDDVVVPAAVHHGPVLFRMYSSDDGEFYGSYDECLQYEEQKAERIKNGDFTNPSAAPKRAEPILFRLYVSSDQSFQGNYDEVMEYEATQMANKTDGSMSGPEARRASRVGEVIVRIYECDDGFRGTYEECVEHEQKMQDDQAFGEAEGARSKASAGKLVMELWESDDGKFRGTYDEVVEYEANIELMEEHPDAPNEHSLPLHQRGEPILLRIYSSDDGNFTGTYQEVLAYEQDRALHEHENEGLPDSAVTAHSGAVIIRIYESDDGEFRGTYDEVVEYETTAAFEHELDADAKLKVPEGKVLFALYVSDDGKFKGSYDEVVKYEELVASGTGPDSAPAAAAVAAHRRSSTRTYVASDGFKGSREEVTLHEKQIAAKKRSFLKKKQQQQKNADSHQLEMVELPAKKAGKANPHGVEESKADKLEAPDGFIGTIEEVTEHEHEHGWTQEQLELHSFLSECGLVHFELELMQHDVHCVDDLINTPRFSSDLFLDSLHFKKAHKIKLRRGIARYNGEL